MCRGSLRRISRRDLNTRRAKIIGISDRFFFSRATELLVLTFFIRTRLTPGRLILLYGHFTIDTFPTVRVVFLLRGQQLIFADDSCLGG